MEKSAMVFSKNVSNTKCFVLLVVLNIKYVDQFDSYMCFPLDLTNSKVSSFNLILDKVRNKFLGWRSNLLNMAGWATMVKSVRSMIPFYQIQCTMSTVSVCNEFDMINKNFVWGPTFQIRKIHLISWDAITRPPKNQGAQNSDSNVTE